MIPWTASELSILLLWSAWWNVLFYLLVTTRRSNRLQHRIALASGCYSHLYAAVDEIRKHHRLSTPSAMISLLSIGFAVRTYLRYRVEDM